MRKENSSTKTSEKTQEGKFINLYGVNNEDVDSDDERELNEEEIDILKQFEENDKELEEIASQICGALDELKGKTENIESSIDRQS